MYRFNEMATALQRSGQGFDDADESEPRKQAPLELWLLQDCCIAQLMEPQFAADAVLFMVLQVWHTAPQPACAAAWSAQSASGPSRSLVD